MWRRATFGLTTIGVLLTCPIVAAGQQSASTPLIELTLEQLGDIEVTSVSKRPEEVWRTPVAIHVITREDIRRSGATSIPEVLRLAPGVEVARIDSDHWAIGVRGFGDQFSKSLLVLIDGRSIYTPLFAGMYWPAHDTLLEDVERIEVIRGPGGTIWGANAVNGVVNIITRASSQTHGALASVGTGNVDRGAGALRYGSRKGALNYRVYGKGVTRGAEHHSDGVNFDDWWTAQAGFRADWTRRPGDTVTLQGELSRGSHGQRVSAASYSPPSQNPLDGSVEASGAYVRGRWQRDIRSGRGFRLSAYYDRTSWLATHFGEKRNTLDIDFVHQLTLADRHALTMGGGTRISPSRFIQEIPTLDFSPRRETDTVYSAFAEDQFELARNRVWLTAGSKIERNNYTGVEVEPSARLLWTPRAGQSVWAAATRAVRTPSRVEDAIVSTAFNSFTATGVPVFLRLTGNPEFGAERMISYEAGYRTRLPLQAYLDVSLFHNRHDGLSSFGGGGVTVEPMPAPVRAVVNVQYVNGVSGTSDGLEIAPDWQVRRWLELHGAYSFIRFDLATAPSSIDVNAVARYSGSSPHHQARAQSQLNLPGGVALDLTYRYVSALTWQKVRAYHTADARVGWTPSPLVELSVSGQNLLSPYHAEFNPAVGIARSVYVELTWRRAGARP